MKSITIHELDDDLDALIRVRARREGLSLDKTIKKLLLASSRKIKNFLISLAHGLKKKRVNLTEQRGILKRLI